MSCLTDLCFYQFPESWGVLQHYDSIIHFPAFCTIIMYFHYSYFKPMFFFNIITNYWDWLMYLPFLFNLLHFMLSFFLKIHFRFSILVSLVGVAIFFVLICKYYFVYIFERPIHWIYHSRLAFISFRTLKLLSHCLLTSTVSVENSTFYYLWR